jgi:predicted ATPase
MVSEAISRLPVRRVQGRADAAPDWARWPATLPAVAQVLRDGLDLGPATVLVGENGTGKSTLTEALALAFGLSREGGSRGAQHSTRHTESDLHESLQLVRGAGASRWGFFLRAETMHGLYTYLEAHPSGRDPVFHEMSHGESFLEILARRFDSPACTCWTSRSRRCRSLAAWRWSRGCTR